MTIDKSKIQQIAQQAMACYPIAGMTLAQEMRNVALAQAVEQDDVPAIREALLAGADINAHVTIGDIGYRRTLLGYAISENRSETVKFLLAEGADTENADALYWAVHSGNTAILKMLLEAGADTDKKNGMHDMTPLHWAADLGGQLEAAKLLLAAGADPFATNRHGITPAELAFRKAFADYIQSVCDDPANRPSAEEVGLDMRKRIAAMERLGKPLGAFTQAEKRRQAQRETREAQRQAALRREGI